MGANSKALLELTEKYGKICMYGGIITPLNRLTFHHCFKFNRDGGQATEYNGSAITRLSHDAVHIMGDDDKRWEQRFKDYIREYKSYHNPEMSIEEFVALKVIQDMRKYCAENIDKRMLEMGYREFLTKDKHLCYTRKWR
jgi:hypothetical protein